MRNAWNDFRMGTAFLLIGWALSIMPSSDEQAQQIAAAIQLAVTGRLK
jgi:hypothetical protein